MAKKKESSAGRYNVSGEEVAREFDISLPELDELIKTRGPDGIRKLNEMYGGLNGLEQKLKTNLITDLSSDEADLRLRTAAFGRNEIPSKSPKNFIHFMFDALKDHTRIILIILSIISLVLSFYPSSKETFEAEINLNSTVYLIPIKHIVVGDICQIKNDDLLPVDGLVVQSHDLKVNESSLNGESDLIEKHESRDPFLLSGK
ncbi:unnamed protein product [Rotaria sp. Silwood2]|nr:unnamed protein product [Rotaria sp. Silwood2]CAF4517343.1 unnamed protein product [Rotaria sp. Silwood2]